MSDSQEDREENPEAKTEPEVVGAESNSGSGEERETGSSDGGGEGRGKGEGEGEGKGEGKGEGEGEPEVVELRAADGVTVHGVLYGADGDRTGPIVLLFHQAGSNAGEYGPIAPRLLPLGYAALAVDQRSGKRRFGRENRTVAGLGKSTGFGPAYRDLEAALTWARERGHRRVIAWGSSYTAALVFRLAAEHGDEIAAVLAFSPGEYMGGRNKVAGWAREVSVPVFVTSAPKEAEDARAIAEAARAEQHVPARGVHGSSILHPERNPSGHEAVWSAVEAFLRRVHD